MAEMREIELPERDDESQSIERFCRLAEGYVLALAADDRFRVEGRVQGTQTREVQWTPADGARALQTLVADYREYFEAIDFPPPDPDVAVGETSGTRIYARGVGLRLITVTGDANLGEQVARLAAQIEAGASPQADAASDEPRQRRLALFAMTWPSARAGRDNRKIAADITAALREASADVSPLVRATALRLVGRYRIAALADEAVAGVDDTHPAVRVAALESLRALDEVAALEPAIRCLADADRGVRQAAFAVARHVGHLPWARRRALMGPLATHLRAAWLGLEAQTRMQALEWLVGCAHDGALQAVAALRNDADPRVRAKAAEVLATLECEGAVATLVGFVNDADEDVQAAAVEALSTDSVRAALQRDDALRESLLCRLAALTARDA